MAINSEILPGVLCGGHQKLILEIFNTSKLINNMPKIPLLNTFLSVL